MNFHTLFNNVSLFIQWYVILVFSQVEWTQRPLTFKAAQDQEQECHGYECDICLFLKCILFHLWRLWFFQGLCSLTPPIHTRCNYPLSKSANRLDLSLLRHYFFIWELSSDCCWREMFSVSFCLVLEISWICVWPANVNNFVILQNLKESGNVLQSGFFSCHFNRESKSPLHTCKVIWMFSAMFYGILCVFLFNEGIFF